MSGNEQPKQRRFRGLVGAGLTVLVTWLFSASPFGPRLRNLSYDLPFNFRPDVSVAQDDAVIVYMDDESHRKLPQSSAAAWNRKLQMQLLKYLTKAQARIIVFDVFFRNADTNDPAGDAELLTAAQVHGEVLFAAILGSDLDPAGNESPAVRRPFEGLVGAERFPCLTNLDCLGLPESVVSPPFRQHHPGSRMVATLAWKCAQLALADPPWDPRQPRWINFYGPENTFAHVSFRDALAGDWPASITVSNKIVFVGSSATVGYTGGSGTDWVRTPYGTSVPGVDLVATVCLNLLRNDWLRSLSPSQERTGFMLLAVLLGYGLAAARPVKAVAIGLGGATVVVFLNYLLFWKAHSWFTWLLPVTVQIPCALAWSLVAHVMAVARAQEAATEKPAAGTEAARVPGPDQTLPVIPDHTVLRRIGEGAYGEVWLARDILGAYHAVKVVRRDRFANARPFEREFNGIQKCTPVSRSHASWVQILHAGRNELAGYFFYIMELGDDEQSGQKIDPDRYVPKTLAGELRRRGKLPLDECLTLSLALAEALEHLHQHGLIHRDIKPANVIFVNGAPKFADIGLVTELRSGHEEVSYLGTEGYIAPEGPGTAAADVYSLGKLMYETSMGRDRRAFPELPTAVLEDGSQPGLDQFIAILLKACEPDPRQRYQSASDLRADLARLQGALRGESSSKAGRAL